MNKQNVIHFWLANARHISLPQSLLPALTAVVAASGCESFSPGAAVIALLGVVFAHLGMNLADDLFDYKVDSGATRERLAADGIRARIAKYPYLTSGQASVRQLKAAICVFLALAAAAGAAITLIRGPVTIYIALAALVIGLSYSGGPLRLGFRAVGEAVIFIMFGPLLMCGCYFAATGIITSGIVWLSAAVGLLVTNIVYTHSIMDAAPDKRIGKRTMAHVMGSPKGMIALSAALNTLPYALIAAGVALRALHPAMLAVTVTLPGSLWLVHSLSDFVNGRECEIKPRAWMGPMGDFDKYRQAGIDWFMLRWLTARNTVMFFCLVAILVSIVFRTC